MISPVGVFETESESFVPGWVIIESSKGSGAFAFLAAILVGEATTRINGHTIVDNI